MVRNMACNILVWNLGSTSFKFKLYDMEGETVVAGGKIAGIFRSDSPYEFRAKTGVQKETMDTTEGYRPCIATILRFLEEVLEYGLSDIRAMGFKTVMAGEISSPCLLDEKTLKQMEKYLFVAPAHNGPYLDAIRILKKLVPQIPMVGSFETAFHQTIPDYAAVYALDHQTARQYGLRKYGFHGAAHSYAAWKYSRLEPDCRRILSIHLGGSSSICAILDGKSVDTSMGFSPQSGLPMNNRNGDVDVFAVLYLMEQKGWTPVQAREFLSSQCGLLGLSGVSNDMEILEGCTEGQLAVDAYAYAAAKYAASFLPALGGLDLISFSGGIGENSVGVKEKICSRLAFLGVRLEPQGVRADAAGDSILISARESAVKVYITMTDEERMVARNTNLVLKKLSCGRLDGETAK